MGSHYHSLSVLGFGVRELGFTMMGLGLWD